MNENSSKFYLVVILLFAVSSFLPFSPVLAQDTGRQEAQQVYLTFRYKGAINNIITAYYKDEQFYLPVISLLDVLGINHQLNTGNLSISGFYLNTDDTYSIHFLDQAHYATFNNRRIELPFESFLIMQLDFYITPAKFKQIFGLNFSVNFNALSLELYTEKTMPVFAALKRERNRERIQKISYDHKGYPLLFGRDRNRLKGGYLDYTLSANLTSNSNIYTYGVNLGAELLGGDVQGQVFGSFSEDFSTLQFNNVRYRYVTDKDNNYLTQIRAGQILSKGLTRSSVLGVSITNAPVVPQILFDNYIVNGNTVPDSEVEIYLNNALVGYQIADGLGNYRFMVPLTYGRSQLRVEIYGPGGRFQQRVDRVEVPFRFVPPGEIYYHVSAGRLENPAIGIADSSYVLQSEISAGLSNRLTVSAGVDYYEGQPDAVPTFYSSLSSRIFTNYNISADIAPQAFYGLSVNAIYPSSLSWQLDYNYYTKDRGIYNILGVNQQLGGSIFVPLSIGNIPLNIRLFANHQFRDFKNLTRLMFNINTRYKRINFRVGYFDTKIGDFSLSPSPGGQITASTTYSISHRPGIPSFLKGSFIRASASYNPNLSKLERIELNLSRDFFQNGNIQLNLSHNFIGDFNVVGFNFTFDFNKVRTNTTFRRIRENSIFTQTLRGSIGFDQKRGRLLFTNRQQVGRGGASFLLYVDENASGNYNEGEELITANAVSLERSGGSYLQDDGIMYLTQLTAYDRYDVTINKGVIKRPLLVPAIEKFSFIAAPNSYKAIDIPFYMSGVISGKVNILRDSVKQPIPGLTVILNEKNGDYHKELRTFTDGSYYSYEIPPGKYVVRIDSSQLAFLKASAKPEEINITVEAKPRGDFIENLNFILMPKKSSKEVSNKSTEVKPRQKKKNSQNRLKESREWYLIQISAWKTKAKALRLADLWASKKYGETKVVQFIDREAGEIWYRVRFKKLFTKERARALKKIFWNKYNIRLWIIEKR